MGRRPEHFTDSERSLYTELAALGRGFGLILLLPGISWLADRTWLLVARRRGAIGAWFGMKALGADSRSVPLPCSTTRHGLGVSRADGVARSGGRCLLLVCGVALARDMNDESAPVGIEAGGHTGVVAYPRLFQRWGLRADPCPTTGRCSSQKLRPRASTTPSLTKPANAVVLVMVADSTRHQPDFALHLRQRASASTCGLGDRRDRRQAALVERGWIELRSLQPTRGSWHRRNSLSLLFPGRITSGP